jgi:hypothetical protein
MIYILLHEIKVILDDLNRILFATGYKFGILAEIFTTEDLI